MGLNQLSSTVPAASVRAAGTSQVVPPFGGHSALVFLLQVGLLLGTALVLGRVAVRLRLPAIVGELAAGIVLGPSVLSAGLPRLSAWLLPQRPAQMNLLDAAAQLGVLLLVALTGMQLDLKLLRRRGGTAASVALAALLVPLAAGLACGRLAPVALRGNVRPAVFAAFLAVAVAASAVPVIAKTLGDLRLLHRNVGQLILAAGALDDMIAWLLLSLVASVAVAGVHVGVVLPAVGKLLAVLLVFVLAGPPFARRVLHVAGDGAGGMQGRLAAAVVLVVLSAALTSALGLEGVLGAFLCGIVLGVCGGPRDWIEPLRAMVGGVLAPLYFATAGLRVQLSALGRPEVAFWALVITAAAVLSKFGGAWIGARLGRVGRWEALAIGAGLNARGVVEIVIASTGVSLGILNTASYTIIVLVAVLTSVMAPPILRTAMRRVEDTAQERLRQQAWDEAGSAPSESEAAHG